MMAMAVVLLPLPAFPRARLGHNRDMILKIPNAFPMVAELREYRVVKPLVERFEQCLNAGKPGFVVQCMLHQLPASTPLIHRSRFPASPAGRCTHSPGSVNVSPR